MFSIEKFSTRLKQLRQETGESQRSVAELLGVTTTQVSDMENGRTTTSFERLGILCDHYKVSADWLLGFTDERE